MITSDVTDVTEEMVTAALDRADLMGRWLSPHDSAARQEIRQILEASFAARTTPRPPAFGVEVSRPPIAVMVGGSD